ncbi:MAG: hypothetical protein JW741_31465 [Sedimentisphaerales bacterium]|nr:hypothetical protein [Sedimentisphaerales bacterium]
MDEKDRTTESGMEKVLRAADVLPPFGAEAVAGSDPKTSARSRGKTGGSKRKNRPAGAAGAKDATQRSMPDGNEIPTFDLAESILARQRSITAGRRRKRSRTASKTDAGQTTIRPMYIDELSAQEQAELQEIVAKIVARDIERLCHRSNVSLPV